MVRIKLIRYISYIGFIASFLVFASFLFSGDKQQDENFVFRGPMPMKVANHENDKVAINPDSSQILKLNSFRCDKIFENDVQEMTRAVTFLRSYGYNFKSLPDEEYIKLTSDCENFVKSREYSTKSVTLQEKQFPVAFNILFYQNVEQLERLLRTIYRPQNQYCIHIDRKTSPTIIAIVQGLAACFRNVFVASKLEVVIYASYTRLTADINCMRDHISRGTDWKYLVNMASSEFPIVSNLQLVNYLQALDGANDIHEVFKTMDEGRFKLKYFTYIDLRTKTGHIIYSKEPKEPPPHDLRITKGNAYNIFSRRFVEFTLNNGVARDLLAWSADTFSPDEHYWATLNNLYSNRFLDTPGGYKGHPDQKPFFGRYIGWNTTIHARRCQAGHYVHNVCVFSVQDLPAIKLRHEIIANKFDIQYDPIAYSCMEEWIRNKTSQQTTVDRDHLRQYRKIAPNANT